MLKPDRGTELTFEVSRTSCLSLRPLLGFMSTPAYSAIECATFMQELKFAFFTHQYVVSLTISMWLQEDT